MPARRKAAVAAALGVTALALSATPASAHGSMGDGISCRCRPAASPVRMPFQSYRACAPLLSVRRRAAGGGHRR
ncbi:hypothetical protein ACIGXF_18550 [Streptomyces sp. NPDC053086]|uniref:hypothetical protein n=1 Tax=unclassified Streptomyces TaxID=2593676 RepID=UPI0037D83F49